MTQASFKGTHTVYNILPDKFRYRTFKLHISQSRPPDLHTKNHQLRVLVGELALELEQEELEQELP